MTVNFNAQQLKAIDDYRNSKNLGYVISDEAVVNQMIKDGKLPECFSSVAQKANPQTPTDTPKNTQIKPKDRSLETRPSRQQVLSLITCPE